MNTINWLSIVLASITPAFIGFFYYHNSVFGKAWMQSLGKTDVTEKGTTRIVFWGAPIVFSVLLSFFLMSFNNDGIGQEGEFDNFLHGAWHGTFVAVAIIIPVTVSNGLFARNSWKSILINVGYWIITIALMGGIVDAMHHWENIPMPGE